MIRADLISYIFILIFWLQGYAIAGEPTFASRTYKECIYEKACVMWMLEYTLTPFQYVDKDKGDLVIKKWDTDIVFGHLGNRKHIYINKLEGLLERIGPYFPHKYKFRDRDVNAVLFASDDVYRDMRYKYSKLFKKILGPRYEEISTPDSAYLSIQGLNYNDDCIGVNSRDLNDNIATMVIIISSPGDRQQECLPALLWNGLGFYESAFSIKQFSIGAASITDLHLLLIEILYYPQIKSGMPLSTALSIADKNYDMILKEFVAKQGVK